MVVWDNPLNETTMEKQGKFILMNISEFGTYLTRLALERTISHIQNHHTWSPSYRNFNGRNHFEKLRGMERSHIQRSFDEVGQNITTFPDGKLAICRNFEKKPACIKLANTGGVCIENLGDFDSNRDVMTEEQRNCIINLAPAPIFLAVIKKAILILIFYRWYNMKYRV
jgi:hypothetical protein